MTPVSTHVLLGILALLAYAGAAGLYVRNLFRPDVFAARSATSLAAAGAARVGLRAPRDSQHARVRGVRGRVRALGPLPPRAALAEGRRHARARGPGLAAADARVSGTREPHLAFARRRRARGRPRPRGLLGVARLATERPALGDRPEGRRRRAH